MAATRRRRADPTHADDGVVDVADAARVAAVFRVLGDASRCRLVYALLRHDEISVGELAATLAMSESNVSHHLSVLRATAWCGFAARASRSSTRPTTSTSACCST